MMVSSLDKARENITNSINRPTGLRNRKLIITQVNENLSSTFKEALLVKFLGKKNKKQNITGKITQKADIELFITATLPPKG